jgi:type II secretory pathway pseudopilin PulG
MNQRHSKRTAFSLVEVVIAMGLISFAMIAILAFFPSALSSSRSSVQDTRAAQIARAIAGTVDSQASTLGSVKCYGLTLDLTSLNTMSVKPLDLNEKLYASYPSNSAGEQPNISTDSSNSIYSVELRFDNDPAAAASLGSGKASLMEIRVFGKSTTEAQVEFFFLIRNKG